VIAACSPADCFHAAIEAFQVAVKYMTPVLLLSDGYLANGSEPWRLPDFNELPRMEISHPTQPNALRGFMPYMRSAEFARPWAVPGTPGLEHRIGGLEKEDVSGNVSYDPGNHEHMVRLRAAKVAGIKPIGQDLIITGPEDGDVLVIGWGSTFGAIKAAALDLQDQGVRVSSCHVRYLNPLPARLGELCRRFKHVLVPELNLGQLLMLLRARFLIDAKPLTKVRGQPFTISDIRRGVKQMLAGEAPSLATLQPAMSKVAEA
jgi:2-oxoglutarate ferredoxin oxidoreductase subunit alpha